jgi:hypothetical protein
MTVKTDNREWISARAVARLLGLTDKTVRRLFATGQLPYRELPGLGRQYSRSGALRLAEACTHDPSRPQTAA